VRGWTAGQSSRYLTAVSRREWLLSLCFVAFILLKVAEAALRLENWPLSDVRMFSHRVPPSVTPFQVTLQGSRGGAWFPLSAADFGLNEDGLMRRLPPDIALLPQRCGALGRDYNARQPPAAQLRGLEARVRRVQRPGVPSRPLDVTVPCLLGAPGAR
jgi:hypothetical protein